MITFFRLKLFQRQLVVLLALLVFPMLSFAEQGWITYAKVSKIVVTSGGGLNVRLTPDLNGCVSQSGYGERYASVYPDHPGLESIHSILLTAYATDKPVAIYLSDATCKVLEVELGGR